MGAPGRKYVEKMIEGVGTLNLTGGLVVPKANVTQSTSKSTAVTANGVAGIITMNATALSGASAVAFTLNNTYITADSVVILTIHTYTQGSMVAADTIADGSCRIVLQNLSASNITNYVISYLVL